jgi:hypothetical protein
MRARKLRILVGTVEVAGTLPDFADGFRRLGHDVATVIRERSRFYPELSYDCDISCLAPDPLTWPDWIRHARSGVVRLPRGAINRLGRLWKWWRLVADHDVFVFQWGGTSLTEGHREYPLLRALGKKIVSVFMGSDVRHPVAFLGQCDGLPRCPDFEQVLRARTAGDTSRPMWNLRQAEHYSDLILSQPNQSGLAVRPYMHLLVPIDLSKYCCNIPGRARPIVVHAPSSKGVKGTAAILAALEQLRNEGVSFELRLLHGVSNREVVAELAAADVAVDQLHLPLHGKFGLEAMASGCALATCNREDYEPFPPNRPIWHIDAENVYERLKRLLTDQELRVRLARQGRAYVERQHDHVIVANRIIQGVTTRATTACDHYPTYFAERFLLPDGEAIPERLRVMTARIIQRWGLPEHVPVNNLIARGLISPRGLSRTHPIPRWLVRHSQVAQMSLQGVA